MTPLYRFILLFLVGIGHLCGHTHAASIGSQHISATENTIVTEEHEAGCVDDFCTPSGSSDVDDASDDDPWEYLRSIIPEGGSLDPLFSLLSEFFFAYRFDEVSRYGEYHFSYSCIWMENRFVLCPKYTYTAIQQRQIELLLHDTFSAFTDVWYQILSDDSFTQRSYRQGFYDDRLDTLLERIPPGNTPSWHRNTHHATFAQTLLDSSFSLGAQYRFENTLLAVLDRHVAEMAEQKCWEVLNEGVCSSKQGTILRYFIPSQEEIFEEEIFHNGDAVQISSLQDEILFRITASEEKYPENDDITLSPETIRHFRTPGNALFFYRKNQYTLQEAMDMIEKTLLSGSISGESTQKDYGALARQYDSPEIPQIFHHIPHDRVVLYIRDPQAVHEWIVRAESQWSRWFGANSTDTVRSFLDRAFRLSSWRAVLASQYQEMAIILENTHLHYPELVYIVSGAQEDTVIQGWKENYRGVLGGYTLIANNQQTLDRYRAMGSETALAVSPDFLYVWARQGNAVKGAILFAGDAFFARLSSLQEVIERYRVEEAQEYLWQIQHTIWAYTALYGGQGDTSILLDTVRRYLASIPDTFWKHLTVDEQGFVSHADWGNIVEFRTGPHGTQALDVISRHEMDRYLSDIRGYQDVWRNVLDPMGIVINPDAQSFWMQFFMTPVPHIAHEDFSSLRWWLEDTAPQALGILKNPRIRSGVASVAFAIDPQKILQKEDHEMRIMELESFLDPLFGRGSLREILNGEFGLTLGTLNADFFDYGWNPRTLDAFVTIGFTSGEHARTSWEHFRQYISSLLGKESGIFSSKLRAAPVVEEYTHGNIYHWNGLDMSFFGEMNIVYTYIDNYVIVGLNGETIRRVLDTAHTGDPLKTAIAHKDTFDDTNFGVLIYGQALRDMIRSWGQQSWKYMSELFLDEYSSIHTQIRTIFTPAWTEYIYSKYLHRDHENKNTLPGISIHFDEQDIFLKMDAQEMEGMPGTLSQKLSPLLSHTGISLTELIHDDGLLDAFGAWLNTKLGSAIGEDMQNHSLLDTTFALHFGDDSIGMTIEFADNPHSDSDQSMGYRWIIVFLVAALILGIAILILIFFLVLDKKTKKSLFKSKV